MAASLVRRMLSMCLVYRGVQKLTANHLSLTFSVKVTPFSQGPNLTANMPFYFYFTQEIDAAQIQLLLAVKFWTQRKRSYLS